MPQGRSDETPESTNRASEVTPQSDYHRKVEARAKVLREEVASLVAELGRLGFSVASPWDLFNHDVPYRRGGKLAAYASAIPILVCHLARPYHPRNREGIVRALTVPDGRVAFHKLVEELRRSRERGDEACQSAVELVLSRAGADWKRQELEQVERHCWESYRFALANAVGYHLQWEHVPEVLSLIRDRGLGHPRGVIIEQLARKLRRWKREHPDALAALREVASEAGDVGNRAKHALKSLRR